MARKPAFQRWVEYIPARLILDAFGLLPRRVAVSLGIGFARLMFPFLGDLRRVGRRNLEIAFPELPPSSRDKLLKSSFDNLGRVLGEVSQFRRATPAGLAKLVEFDFEPELRAAYEEEKRKGRGTILVGPHLGNWEMGVFAYSAIYEPLTYLARPMDNELIEEMVASVRARFGNRAINKTNSVYSAIELLRNGGILGVLPDVNVKSNDGVFVPFFGVPACTTGGVAMLAMRTNAMIVPMCTAWIESEKRYKVVHGSIIEADSTGDRHADVVSTTAEITSAMEVFVRRFPDQWLWIHKRWKTRPPGENEFY